jgi:tetratricopeptide (TPR) repeat protein
MGSIQAVVEHGTLALDDTDYLYQGDRVRIGGPLSQGGHFYSHQPPMLAILGAVPYGLLHCFGRAIDDPGSYRFVTTCVVGLPLLLGLLCLGRLMLLAGASPRETSWLLAASAFGTLALPYALVLNQHGTAAGLVMAGLLQVQRHRYGWAGALLGLATAVDLTALFFGLSLLLPIARSGAVPGIIRYGAGALPPLALYLGINYAIVGDFIPLGLHVEAFEYPRSPFLLMKLTGDVSSGDSVSQGEYVFGALFGSSGLFSHHPVLLLAVVAGLWSAFESMQRASASGGQPLALTPSLDHAIFLGSAGICLYYLVESRNFGGSSFGMRWFCVFAPSLLLLLAVWVGARPSRKLPIALFAPLLAWSVAGAGLGAIQPWIKITYRWQDSERGRAALRRGETIPALEHWVRQWLRTRNLSSRFDEARYERDYLWLLYDHRSAYLLPRPDQTEEEHRKSMEAGLAKLERAVALLDEEAVEAGSRAWAHYWRAQFYRRLGQQEAAERDIEITLELNPDFYRSPSFDRARRARREEDWPPRR